MKSRRFGSSFQTLSGIVKDFSIKIAEGLILKPGGINPRPYSVSRTFGSHVYYEMVEWNGIEFSPRLLTGKLALNNVLHNGVGFSISGAFIDRKARRFGTDVDAILCAISTIKLNQPTIFSFSLYTSQTECIQ